MAKKNNSQEKRMPGEFKQTEIIIGKDNCRSSLQYYYAIGGYQDAFAEFKGEVIQIDKNRGYLFKRLYPDGYKESMVDMLKHTSDIAKQGEMR